LCSGAANAKDEEGRNCASLHGGTQWKEWWLLIQDTRGMVAGAQPTRIDELERTKPRSQFKNCIDLSIVMTRGIALCQVGPTIHILLWRAWYGSDLVIEFRGVIATPAVKLIREWKKAIHTILSTMREVVRVTNVN
jgi:hypothetical protein